LLFIWFVGEKDGVPDHGEADESEHEKEPEIEESIFTFEAYETVGLSLLFTRHHLTVATQKFAHPEITASLLAYLARYKEFTTAEPMKRIVNLLHRQAVRAKAEGIFFQVSTLDLFKTVLKDRDSLPREQPYADLVQLIKYILRQFFKAVENDSMVLVEAFFPMSRGRWKKLSSWEPPKPLAKEGAGDDPDNRRPVEVQVKKGHSWSEQVAIAMAALTEADKADLIEWTKDVCPSASHFCHSLG
jgi:replication fork protection complex subunit Tof1/Swi1